MQFDLVAVSGANQYKVNPLALVSTVALPIFAVFSAELDAAAGEAAALEAELPDPAVLPADELPHAAATRARPARPAGAHHLLRITYPR